MSRKIWTSLLVFMTTLGAVEGAAATEPTEAVRWEGLTASIAGSTVEFQPIPGREVVPALQLAPLKELQLISWLKPSVGAIPYLLLSATSPDVAERSLFIVRADGRLKPQRMTYPGRLLDPKSRETIHESRAFYGRCLPDQQHDALVFYQRDRLDKKNRMHASLYVAEASPNFLTERLSERSVPPISRLQIRVRMRQCAEIPGKNRFFDAGFFQFRNRGADLPNDEDDEEKKDPENDDSAESASRKTLDNASARAERMDQLMRLMDGS
jgi:hypothetical protein